MSVLIKHSIVAALKKNLLPGLVLQSFALIILLLYFFVPAAKPVFSWFNDLKEAYGFGYAFFATALFGGVIPFTYLWATGQLDPSRNVLGLLLFHCVFWGYKGMEVDAFYRLQGILFGYENTWQTLLAKVAVDQFIYTVFWVTPTVVVGLMWADYNYSFRACRQAINREFFRIKIPAIIFSNWLVWFPAIAIVYSMPKDLQIPLFNLVLCFWVLLLSVLNKKSHSVSA
ncbi:MAG TPA: hypothetical protein VN030_02070 [Cellvibrio sp.]|nr:hypothetical protein [Cellvibrio sp.]